MIKVLFEVRDDDTTWKKIREGMRKAAERGIEIRAGLLEPEASKAHGELTNGEVGVVHEFGTGHVPSRSFMREPFDSNRDKYLRMLVDAFKGIYVAQYKLPDVLVDIAREMAKDMRAAIRDGIPPPLRRGDRTPLYKTKQLHDAIRGEVVVGGKIRRR